MWNSFRALPTNLLRHTEQLTQPKRTTFVLRRKHPPRLDRLGTASPKKFKTENFYYELVEDRDCKKKPPVDLILTADVPGIGMKGEKIETNVYIAYRDLLLPKLAVYADSPEAQSIAKIGEEKKYSSIYSKIVENYLADQPVQIILSGDVKWTLKPWHVRLALRKNGILTNAECINVPKEISGPDSAIENRDFLVYLTMNKTEVFPLRCRIYHWSTLEPLSNQRSFNIHEPSEPLFADEKEAIDAMIKMEQDIKRNKMIRGVRT